MLNLLFAPHKYEITWLIHSVSECRCFSFQGKATLALPSSRLIILLSICAIIARSAGFLEVCSLLDKNVVMKILRISKRMEQLLPVQVRCLSLWWKWPEATYDLLEDVHF